MVREATVRQLRIFAAAARHLSFSEAARALRVTQPAVSMQMKQLEALAGLPLFERAGRGLSLTPAGEEMLRRAQEVLRALDEADEAFAVLRGVASSGQVGVGAVSTAKYFAPRLLARFSKEQAGVDLKLSVANRDEVVRLLVDGEVDLALMGTPPRDAELSATAFAKHPLVVVAAPEHPLAARRGVPVAALSGEPFLVRERGSGTRAAMERFFAAHRARPASTTEISSNETIKQAVMAGMGLAFLSRHAIALELAAGRIAELRVEGLPVVRDWCVAQRRGRPLSPAADAFKRFVLAQGARFLEEFSATGI